jgi:hypothetical protein
MFWNECSSAVQEINLKAVKSPLSANSALHDLRTDGDFLDCYSVPCTRPETPIEKITQQIFLGMPRWAGKLLSIRDKTVELFGLKTTKALPSDHSVRQSLQEGEYVNFFKVRTVTENEIILGEDDKHLDFRISVYRDKKSAGPVSLSTLVHTHNLLGKVYLTTIKPFHILIVTSQLKRAIRQLEDQ